MNTSFVDQLDITDIYQEIHENSRIDIYFTLNNELYSVTVSKIKGDLYEPFYVYHESKQYCELCEEKDEGILTVCNILNKHRNELFHRLIEHPSIRLGWLYIPHISEE